MRHVNLVASFNATGVGTLAESYFLGLSAVCARHPAGFVPRHYEPNPRSIDRLVRRAEPADSTLFFWQTNPNILQKIGSRRLLWFMFESTRLPRAWIEGLRHYDAVWVSSGWAREVLRSNGYQGTIQVVAAGVSADRFAPNDSSAPWEAGTRRLRVLMVGKFEKRKGYDVALQALARVSKQVPLTLVAKPDYFIFPERAGELRRMAESMGVECELVSGLLSTEALAGLYRSCDLFLFPSRAEGFGLPCIEALACGLPTLATRYSGQSVFLDAVGGLYREIRYDMAPLVDDDYAGFYGAAYGQEPLGEWAEPSVDSIVEGVRDIASDHAAWIERGRRAAGIIRERFGWKRVAEISLPHLAPVTSTTPSAFALP
jgi:glycosyltransferase involved in cell wall biosynthesis